MGNKESSNAGSKFAVGDEVTWKGSDEDIPTGSVGRVAKVERNGDVEVLFKIHQGWLSYLPS